jgi:hypothetical protein
MKKVMQYTCQAHSKAEAELVAAGLRLLDGCLDARPPLGYNSSIQDPHARCLVPVTAHFEIDQGIPEEVLPEGCRLVPESVAAYLQRTNPNGVVKKLSLED